ncbi:Cyclin CCL1 [Neolecta irregularis DAH-3]|uniref:Cyclin CCL1 n=1 Tax=Neolecta irregularis (strain DAH-3) TaxID=1198029 RepID=A0A1U7LWP5_NEOID|nr:Cyclin CCL1 [Neolecta irregularis DAH-3]|eukprot:OLL26931.1 Cyclin CCL1 [Neolecta irregularis DAH-3]
MKEDDLYRQTSQFRLWSFTPTALQDLRRRTNSAAIEKISDLIREDGKETSGVDFLSWEEELELVNFYVKKMNDIAGVFKLPSSIKTENYYIPLEKFVSTIPKTTVDDIIPLELPVSQSLKFCFSVHHPYRPLHGFYLDMQAVLPNYEKDRLGKLIGDARNEIGDSLYGDSMFLYTPSQISLACLRSINSSIIQLYIQQKITDDALRERLLNEISAAQKLIKDFKFPSKERVVEIDKKRYYCQNPERNPNSQVFKKRKQQEENGELEKANKKAKMAEQREKEAESFLGPCVK